MTPADITPDRKIPHLIQAVNNVFLTIVRNSHRVSLLRQYGLWSFQTGGYKIRKILPKNQHTQRKLLKIKNWVNGEMSKSAKI